MTPILITKQFEDAAQEYRKNLETLLGCPQDILGCACQKMSTWTNFTEQHWKYIEMIIQNWDNLVVAKPSEINSLIQQFGKYSDLPSTKLTHASRIGHDITTTFADALVYEMRYAKVRTVLAPILLKLGIKTCFYCNAQYAVSSRNEAYYDFDHIYPKDKYPFLCVSFFNLIPACAVCNRHKSDNDGLISPYVEQPSFSPFVFRYTHGAGNLLDPDLFKIYFEAKDKADRTLCKNYDDKFRISRIYANHRDVAVEIEKKRTDFNESGLKALFATLGNHANKDIVQRVLLGTYNGDENVHRRPLSKFINDTSRDLIERIWKFKL